MESRTDSELLAVVSDPSEDWEPEAIVAAQEELRKRGLAAAEKAGPFRTSAVREVDGGEPEAKEPLSFGARSIAFLVGFLVGWPCLLVAYLVSRKATKGEQHRSKERLHWVGLGFCMQIVVFFMFKSCH